MPRHRKSKKREVVIVVKKRYVIPPPPIPIPRSSPRPAHLIGLEELRVALTSTSFKMDKVDEYIEKHRNSLPTWEILDSGTYTLQYGQIFLGIRGFFQEWEDFENDTSENKIKGSFIRGRLSFDKLLSALRHDVMDMVQCWIEEYTDTSMKMIQLDKIGDELAVKKLRVFLSVERIIIEVANMIADRQFTKDYDRATSVLKTLTDLKVLGGDYMSQVRHVLTSLKVLVRESKRLKNVIKETETLWNDKLKKYYGNDRQLLLANQDVDCLYKKEMALASSYGGIEQHKIVALAFLRIIRKMMTICYQMRCPIPATVEAAQIVLKTEICNVVEKEIRNNSRLKEKFNLIHSSIKMDAQDFAKEKEKDQPSKKAQKPKFKEPCSHNNDDLVDGIPLFNFAYDAFVSSLGKCKLPCLNPILLQCDAPLSEDVIKNFCMQFLESKCDKVPPV